MINFLQFFKMYFSLLASASQVILALLGVIIILGWILSFVEGISFFKALYFSFITALTIGYGDVIPCKPLGRIISVLQGITGMIFAGIMVAAAIKSLELSSQRRKKR